jgi:hypothetical protein
MTPEEVVLNNLMLILHERVGVCYHCGKRTCAGRKSQTRLPLTIRTDDLCAAIETITKPQ